MQPGSSSTPIPRSICLSPEGAEGGTKLGACAFFGQIRELLLVSGTQLTSLGSFPPSSSGEYIGVVDSKRNQLETRVATLELMLVTERARPKPDKREMEKLEKELAEARSALQKYSEEHP
jgi:hypothetical protein